MMELQEAIQKLSWTIMKRSSTIKKHRIKIESLKIQLFFDSNKVQEYLNFMKNIEKIPSDIKIVSPLELTFYNHLYVQRESIQRLTILPKQVVYFCHEFKCSRCGETVYEKDPLIPLKNPLSCLKNSVKCYIFHAEVNNTYKENLYKCKHTIPSQLEQLVLNKVWTEQMVKKPDRVILIPWSKGQYLIWVLGLNVF